MFQNNYWYKTQVIMLEVETRLVLCMIYTIYHHTIFLFLGVL